MTSLWDRPTVGLFLLTGPSQAMPRSQLRSELCQRTSSGPGNGRSGMQMYAECFENVVFLWLLRVSEYVWIFLEIILVLRTASCDLYLRDLETIWIVFLLLMLQPGACLCCLEESSLGPAAGIQKLPAVELIHCWLVFRDLCYPIYDFAFCRMDMVKKPWSNWRLRFGPCVFCAFSFLIWEKPGNFQRADQAVGGHWGSPGFDLGPGTGDQGAK